ncbi:PP2C family protein-serine/threonine phosphatase [Anaerosporobacter sp.]
MEQRIQAGVFTIKGSFREKNEDNFFINHQYRYQEELEEIDSVELDLPSMCVLCDGMGGTGYGREASQTVVQSIAKNENRLLHRQPNISVYESLEEMIQEANQKVIELADMGKKTGSTLALVYCESDQIYYANIGDSKIYQYKDNKIKQLSRDHNQAAMLLEIGNGSNHLNRMFGQNRLTQYLGISKKEFVIEPHYGEIPYEPMILVLCSDGLMETMTEQTLETYLKEYCMYEANEIARKLVEQAQILGARDNITAIILKIS